MIGCVITGLTLSSCGRIVSSADHELEIAALRETNEMSIDSLRLSYQNDMSDIEDALEEIRNNYGYVELGPNSNVELSQAQTERIANNLGMIADVLEENRLRIETLESKVAGTELGKQELASQLKHLKQKLIDTEWMYASLKDEFAARGYKIKELEQNLSDAEQSISYMYDQSQLNKAKAENKYLAFGSKKLLKETQVVKKDGKLFGGLVVNENLNTSELMPVNMYQTTCLSFDTPDPTIVSKHPSDSYTVEKSTDGTSLLLINNPESFWKTSNILVVAVN